MKILSLKLPKSWDELSEKQLIYLSRLLFEKVPEQELLTRCFMKFTGLFLIQHNPVIIRENDRDILCYEYKKKGLDKATIDVDTFADMVSKLSWIADEVTLFKNIPKIKRFSGSNYKLFDITLEEYLVADNMYIAWSKTGDMQYLNKMVAIFYRRKADKWADGIHLASWAKRFNKVPAPVKFSVFLWYTGVKAWIIKKYPFIFSSGSTVDASPSDSVMNILAALSGGDVTKNTVIKRSNVHEALDVLNRKIEQLQR